MREYEGATFLIKKKEENKKEKNKKKIKRALYLDDLIDEDENKQIRGENVENINYEENKMTLEQYQICLTRIFDLIQFNFDFNLQNNDIYLNGLLRCINQDLPLFYEWQHRLVRKLI